jgi:hypothetical protein
MKGYKGLFILCAVLLLCMAFVPPAFAERKAIANDKKVSEAELARLRAPVTAASVVNLMVVIEKDEDTSFISQEREMEKLQDGIIASPQAVKNTTQPITQERIINGQKFLFGLGGSTTITSGGITSVTPR